MNKIQQQTEALDNAQNNQSLANYPAIFEGFLEKGIPESDIEPRVNVFTYRAWQALGRQVRRGERGVKVVTWIPMTKKRHDDDDDPEKIGRRPKTTTVFHVSQTDPIETIKAA